MHSDFLPYFRPSITDADMRTVTGSMQNGWLTTGPSVREFELSFAKAAGVKHAIAVNSCTAGLLLGMIALKLAPGDEVIMPSLTFVAGANCARQLGAVAVFADVDPETLCITPDTIERVVTPKTKLIVPMHYAGYPARIQEIVAFAKSRNIAVFEDAAHAAGTLVGGKWAGQQSDGASYSFYATKNLTTAEGGMVLTNRDDVMESVRNYALHGMDRDAWKRYGQGGRWRYDVTVVGHKFNMPDMCAALGLSQLDRLESMQLRRNQIAMAYNTAFRDIAAVRPVAPELKNHDDRHAWCMYVIRVYGGHEGAARNGFIDALSDRKIGTSVHYIPTHLFTAYTDSANANLPTTNDVWQQLISLPLYPDLTDDNVQSVIDAVSEVALGGSHVKAIANFS